MRDPDPTTRRIRTVQPWKVQRRKRRKSLGGHLHLEGENAQILESRILAEEQRVQSEIQRLGLHRGTPRDEVHDRKFWHTWEQLLSHGQPVTTLELARMVRVTTDVARNRLERLVRHKLVRTWKEKKVRLWQAIPRETNREGKTQKL